MSTFGRVICLVVLAVPVLTLSAQDKSVPPPKPPAASPAAKPSQPAAKGTPPQSEIEKRRERMKQRDGEMDRILKGKAQQKDR
ncbi:MAG: hypothetical protein ABIR70_10820 [Bryobacteraceae bacterium]